MGERIVVYDAEPTWNGQHKAGVQNIVSQVKHTNLEISLKLFPNLSNEESEINPTFSTTVVLLATLLDSLIHQWTRHLISIGLIKEGFANTLDFFNHSDLLKTVKKYNNTYEGNPHPEPHTASAIDFSYNKATDEMKRQECPTGMRDSWVKLLYELRSIFVHRGVYLLRSNIIFMSEILEVPVGEEEDYLSKQCLNFLVLIMDQIDTIRNHVIHLMTEKKKDPKKERQVLRIPDAQPAQVIKIMGESIAVFQTEPTWEEQQKTGAPNIVAKIGWTNGELRRIIGLHLACRLEGMSLHFSTGVILCANMLDSLIHQLTKKFISLGLMNEKEAEALDFFKHKSLMNILEKYNEFCLSKSDQNLITIDATTLSFNKPIAKTNTRDDLTVQMRCPWVDLLLNLRNIFVHRGIYLLNSDINSIYLILHDHDKEDKEDKEELLSTKTCHKFLNLITTEIKQFQNFVSTLLDG